MARQVRSEITRRKLIDAAIDVFEETGYVSAGRTAIIARAGVTKGALYHHFDSMEALVAAIVEGGYATVLDAFRSMCRPSAPALEGLLQGMFAVVTTYDTDKQAKATAHLLFALSRSGGVLSNVSTGFTAEVVAQAERAIAEGDLRPDLDPTEVTDLVVGAVLGTWMLSQAIGGDSAGRMARTWAALLPAIVAPEALPYFQQFLARETARYQPQEPVSG